MKTLNTYLAADNNTLRGKIDGTIKVKKEINDPMVQFMIKVMATYSVIPNELDENEVNGYQLYTAIAKFIQRESWGIKIERHLLNRISANPDDNTIILNDTDTNKLGYEFNVTVWIKDNFSNYYQASFAGANNASGGNYLTYSEYNGNRIRLNFSTDSLFLTGTQFQGILTDRIIVFVRMSKSTPNNY